MNEKDVFNLKRGYLKEDFRYFHLKEQKDLEFEYHYHDFNKIIVFLSGGVTYNIEGKSYKLRPWDILIVGKNDLHKPEIEKDEPYERVILWVNSKFLEKHNTAECDLLTLFELSSRQKNNLVRLTPEGLRGVKRILNLLGESQNDNDFGSHILRNSLFLQLMVSLNRLYMGSEPSREDRDIKYDRRISDIIDYINGNLCGDLSADLISSRFYMNKYYLMHRFKEITGYTLHYYIQQKRLVYSASLIVSGMSVTDACIDSGFGDYSSFVRAFKKEYGLPPKKYYKTIMKIESSDN